MDLYIHYQTSLVRKYMHQFGDHKMNYSNNGILGHMNHHKDLVDIDFHNVYQTMLFYKNIFLLPYHMHSYFLNRNHISVYNYCQMCTIHISGHIFHQSNRDYMYIVLFEIKIKI